MAALWLHTTLLLVLLATWCPGSGGFPLETLCGVDLLNALDFVCSDTSYFGRTNNAVQRFQAQSEKVKQNIVEQCCYKPCSLFSLYSFCV